MTLFFKNLKAAILSMKGEAMHQMWDDALAGSGHNDNSLRRLL